VLVGADAQLPPLPPKDVIHRIYRDVRFSNDKTPYKRSFSASFSRSGRKGIFAGCACRFGRARRALTHARRSYVRWLGAEVGRLLTPSGVLQLEYVALSSNRKLC
jgi:hypothetical protein